MTARMIPQYVSEDTRSRAEIRLFHKIRDELSDEWIVLHSLGLAGHPSKPWAEIDFVLIGPDGVFCLEVKGGRVAREGGVWLFTDRSGKTHRKREGPFEQAAGASAALYGYLRNKRPAVRDSVLGYAVATPDIRFEVQGPDIEKDVVYDERDLAPSFTVYVKRLADYWRKRLDRGSWRELSATEREEILASIRADFDLRPSLRSRIRHTNEELLRLTKQQYQVLDGLADNSRVLIRGAAGTGKTLLAVEETHRQSRAGRTVLLCCFNKRLALFLAELLKDTPGVTVRHIHGLMSDYIREADLVDQLPRAEEEDLFRVFYPELCIQALEKLGRLREFDTLIVDEGQDVMLGTYVDVLEKVLRNGLKNGCWKIFLDSKQNIFDAFGGEGLARLLSCGPAQFKLSLNCRNTAPIAVMTGLLSGTRVDETLRVDGPRVETYWYADPEQQCHQISECANRLLSEGVQPREVVFLSRRRWDRSVLSRGSTDIHAKIADLVRLESPTPRNAIGFATVRLFKGLEADAVMLIDCDDLGSDEGRLQLYVGASRARVFLAVFIDETCRVDFERRAFEYGKLLSSPRAQGVADPEDAGKESDA